MTNDITSLARNLQQDAAGVWCAAESATMHYADDDHDVCFAVESGSFWFRHRAKCIVQVMRNFAPEGTMLDVGGGNGYMTEYIGAAGFDCVLMEPGERGVRNALKRGVDTIIRSTLEQAGFPDNSIPAIGVFDVVEHIEHDLQFLESIRRSLIPGGKLYLTVPAYDFLWSHEDEAAEHFRRYTLRKIEARLDTAGFDVLFKTYIFWVLPLPIFVLRTLPHWVGLGAERSPEQVAREHAADPGSRSGLLEKLLSWELNRLKNNRPIPFGGSCLVAAAVR